MRIVLYVDKSGNVNVESPYNDKRTKDSLVSALSKFEVAEKPKAAPKPPPVKKTAKKRKPKAADPAPEPAPEAKSDSGDEPSNEGD